MTAVAAPVRVELNTGSLWPTTVTVSAMVATFSVELEILRDAEASARCCLSPRS